MKKYNRCSLVGCDSVAHYEQLGKLVCTAHRTRNSVWKEVEPYGN